MTFILERVLFDKKERYPNKRHLWKRRKKQQNSRNNYSVRLKTLSVHTSWCLSLIVSYYELQQ